MFYNSLKQIYLLFLVIISIVVNAQTIYGKDKLLESVKTDDLENPEETGPYLEGDINVENDEFRRFLRNGLVSASSRWPQAAISYEIEGTFGTKELTIISHAFNEYHTKTCVRFHKRSSEKDYIVLTNKPSGCWSNLGRIGGRQEVNLESPKCFSNYGTTIHEIMHALGFHHEQNRFERDSYVKVITDNIKPNKLGNFRKLSQPMATGFGVPYDYASVMHYKANSFSKNGKPTLEALQATPEATKMGQRYGFSKGDLFKINNMYRCR